MSWIAPAARSMVVARCATSASPSSSYFDVLGVSESANLEEIKAAFRTRSKLLHPDVNKAPTAARDFMLLRRAYTTLSTAELRAEYEAKLGMPSARSRDPRFARFERWRREVLPDLHIQLDVWSRGLEGYLAAWRASLEQREQNLARLYRACCESLQQLQELRSAAAEVSEQQQQQPYMPGTTADCPEPPMQQQPQPQPHPQPQLRTNSLLYPEDVFASMASTASVDSTRTLCGSAGDDAGGGGCGCTAVDALAAAAAAAAAAEAGLRDMAAEVAGIASDCGDGTARVEREVEKRYQQVSMRYPAYPDIVWMDVWEETSEQWLAQSAAEAQRCAEASSRWSARLRHLQERLQAATLPELQGQIAGAGTGRFHAT
ncbi:hypothetical protein PLESTB_001538800 [Pleodorina starrii]|uniref:J domain-containing protein n=1 Tax=Pleodorina starrii TaxID=330485 RepID=A0A9W6F7Y8_9CHLO|nr:hypothetical protein PLESTM_001844000 [Pleodorina starrii]GLC59817.1 hypothetical protein PLESTB_001538800 [Pleodorina starrii]